MWMLLIFFLITYCSSVQSEDDKKNISIYNGKTMVQMVVSNDDDQFKAEQIHKAMDCTAQILPREENMHSSVIANALEIDIKDMIYVLRHCNSDPSKIKPQNESLIDSIRHFFTGILPQTKWCGINNDAKGYDDVGEALQTDLCCRAHDHCPMNVLPNERIGDSVNKGIYTLSHCLCDQEFHDCLEKVIRNPKTKELDVTASKEAGSAYFKWAKSPCVMLTYDPTCPRNPSEANESSNATVADCTKPTGFQLHHPKNNNAVFD